MIKTIPKATDTAITAIVVVPNISEGFSMFSEVAIIHRKIYNQME